MSIYFLSLIQRKEWRNGLPVISTAKDSKGGEGGLSTFNVEV